MVGSWKAYYVERYLLLKTDYVDIKFIQRTTSSNVPAVRSALEERRPIHTLAAPVGHDMFVIAGGSSDLFVVEPQLRLCKVGWVQLENRSSFFFSLLFLLFFPADLFRCRFKYSNH
jgi:hypothetical protein